MLVIGIDAKVTVPVFKMLSQLWGSGDGTQTVITDCDQCHGEVQLV